MTKKWLWVISVGVVVSLVGGLGYAWRGSGGARVSQTVSVGVTPTQTVIPAFSPSATYTPTSSATMTPTLVPSTTPTLATRVVSANLVMPEVTLPPSATPVPEKVSILADPPAPLEPLPNATLMPAPYTAFTSWIAFESDHPSMRYIKGSWTAIGSRRASRGQYHFTEDTTAQVQFRFVGAAVRVRYVGFTNGGIWQVWLDGQLVEDIDAYAPSGIFTSTRVYTLATGAHTLELHNTDRANSASSGHLLALDAIQVYRPDELTLLAPGGVLPTATPTPTLIPARKLELIAAPPSPQPTATDRPLQVVSAAIVIGYDENANGSLDVSEGVSGISVRLVEATSNQGLAQAFTDEQGFVQLEAATNSAVQLVVPYFGATWTLSGHTEQHFSLLLAPGNQPGLMP